VIIKKDTKVISLRVPLELFEDLRKARQMEGRSTSNIAIAAITSYLERLRIAREGAAPLVAEFDRSATLDMKLDRTLQTAAVAQARPKPAPEDDSLPAVDDSGEGRS
jgi:hypothetical protein